MAQLVQINWTRCGKKLVTLSCIFKCGFISRNKKVTHNKLGINLDSGGIHHNPHPLAHGLWWEVLGELCSDRPSVAMRSGHLAPNDSKVGFLRLWLIGDRSLVLGPVDVCAPLADVPGSVVLAIAALDLEESSVLVLVPQAALEPGENSLGVEPS